MEQFLIPILPREIQDSLAAKVQQIFDLKTPSEQLLEKAKRVVEVAIAEGETAGMKE